MTVMTYVYDINPLGGKDNAQVAFFFFFFFFLLLFFCFCFFLQIIDEVSLR